jgi:multidrug efflux system membrane fusion protein
MAMMWSRRWRREFPGAGAGIFAVALSLITFFAFSRPLAAKNPERPAGAETVPVTVGTAILKSVPVQLQAIGRVEAYSTVSLKSRLDGQLTRVHFQEGQEVRKGDLLFTIDPRPLEVALMRAQAELDRDKALAEKADTDLRRYADLVRKDYVSKQQYDEIRASADALKATVAADKASVENARLQLSYCFIRAPFTGITGNLLVDQGSMIKANADTGMVDIVQIQPIYVSFSVPEQNLPSIKKHMAAERLRVEAAIPGEEGTPELGILTFLDNQVNSQTGTILLKGTFANKDRRLWPGQFVNAVLTLTTRPHAVVIPSRAVQAGQDGEYVFVVKPDLTVESRPVVVGITLAGEVVIDKGLEPGEQVVTDGQLRLAPGARVQIKNASKADQETPP